MTIEADLDFSRYGLAAATELTVCIMSVRNDFSQLSAVSPTASALTLQTTMSIPPSSAAAASIHAFKAPGSATSSPRPDALTPFARRDFTAFATSSALRAQIATLAPSPVKSSAIASPMPLLPPVTSTLFPLSPRSMAASVRKLRPASFRESRPRDELHLGPVAGAFERRGSPIDRRFVAMLADQHQADRQSIAHPARQAHRRMSAGIERRVVRNHLEGALEVEFARRIRRRQRGCLHRQRRHQQEIVFGERRIIGRTQLAVQVLCLGVEMAAIVLGEILSEQHRDLEAV